MMMLAALSLLMWAYLLLAHGQFWRSGPELEPARPNVAPPVTVVVPARDEAAVIRQSLRSLLAQDYAGPVRVIVVNDSSSDGTGVIARSLAQPTDKLRPLTVVDGGARPPGWSGKLWAVAQGLAEAEAEAADLILLTDADIEHDPRHVATLVARAERDDLDLVSEMVALASDTRAERALAPAFVFFFQLLYPFARVNDPLRAEAAAAGGTILIRRRALQRIGGIAAVRGALIDDVALARAVKRGGRIWLGHSVLARSVRAYPTAADIWRMVSRTAYVQLRFSPLLLLATVLAMALTFLVPPYAVVSGHGLAAWLGFVSWSAMGAAYCPTLRRFGRSVMWAPILPVVAAFYLAATMGSAANHYLGRGVAWKGRAYFGAGA
jgi:hopene-associated glycosyltransferase HpnB